MKLAMFPDSLETSKLIIWALPIEALPIWALPIEPFLITAPSINAFPLIVVSELITNFLPWITVPDLSPLIPEIIRPALSAIPKAQLSLASYNTVCVFIPEYEPAV